MKLRIYYKPAIDGQVAEHHSSVTVSLEEGQDGRFQLVVQTLDELLGAGNYDLLYHERINDDDDEGQDTLTHLKRIKEEEDMASKTDVIVTGHVGTEKHEWIAFMPDKFELAQGGATEAEAIGQLWLASAGDMIARLLQEKGKR